MSTIRAIREKAIWESPKTGYGIYRCKRDNQEVITVVGFDIPAAGSCWICMVGDWIENPTYGHQFRAEECTIEKTPSEEGVADYLMSLKIGIGRTRAAAIVKYFGDKTWDILDNFPERLQEVPSISKKMVDEYIKIQTAKNAVRDLMQMFNHSELFKPFHAKDIVKVLGAESVPTLKKNPYLLCKYTDLNFKEVDQIVSRMDGYSETFLPRLTQAVYYVMNNQEKKGHTCIPEPALKRAVLSCLNAQGRKPVDKETVLARLKEMVNKKSLYALHGMVFLRKRYYEEYHLVDGLIRLMNSTPKNAGLCKNIGDELLNNFEENEGIEFAPGQKAAIKNIFNNPVSIVTGGPGTGKTTLTKAVISIDRYVHRKKSNPLLLAPTGRAAKRLSEATNQPAQTIHSAIHYCGQQEAPEDLMPMEPGTAIGDATIIIVDEVSMLDQMIASWLVQVIPNGARLVFIGDSNQLPSVGAGNVLADLISSGVVPTTQLTEIFRQAEESLIVRNAEKIRNGEHDLIFTRDFRPLQYSDPEQILRKTVQFYDLCTAKYTKEQIMILCPYRIRKNTIVNTQELNNRIQAHANPVKEDDMFFKRGDTKFHVGDRVIQLKNTPEVTNGDIGIVESFTTGSQKEDANEEDTSMIVDFGMGVKRKYNRDTLSELDLAYCTTVHKSQGCEYPVIILLLSNEHGGLLQRNLVYTAITRSSDKVCLIGDIVGENSALIKAIDNTRPMIRHSLLAARLKATWAKDQAERGKK